MNLLNIFNRFFINSSDFYNSDVRIPFSPLIPFPISIIISEFDVFSVIPTPIENKFSVIFKPKLYRDSKS